LGGWGTAEDEEAVGGVADAWVFGAVEDVPAAVEGMELWCPDALTVLLLFS